VLAGKVAQGPVRSSLRPREWLVSVYTEVVPPNQDQHYCMYAAGFHFEEG